MKLNILIICLLISIGSTYAQQQTIYADAAIPDICPLSNGLRYDGLCKSSL